MGESARVCDLIALLVSLVALVGGSLSSHACLPSGDRSRAGLVAVSLQTHDWPFMQKKIVPRSREPHLHALRGILFNWVFRRKIPARSLFSSHLFATLPRTLPTSLVRVLGDAAQEELGACEQMIMVSEFYLCPSTLSRLE